VILDLQMCMGWWQWQDNAGDDGGNSAHGGVDDDDCCHGPTGNSVGVYPMNPPRA